MTSASGQLPVYTAVTDPSLEAELVGAFGSGQLGVSVLRRCVDLVELLSAASVRSAEAALVSGDLRGLDRAAVSQLASYGVVIVGIAADEAAERLLHQLGVAAVVPSGASAAQVAGALRAAVLDRAVAAQQPVTAESEPGGGEEVEEPQSGIVVAVWGPTGAPGRSTVALGLADVLATRTLTGLASGAPGVLLVDADPYGGAIAQLAGMLDEAPGLAAACRAGNAGTLDVARLAGCCRELLPGLRVLTGLDDAVRWPELRPGALELVLRLARRTASVTIVDCGFGLDDADPLAGTLLVHRNAATLTALRAADRIVVVAGADPVGLARAVRGVTQLADALGVGLEELVESQRLVVVVNRIRPGLASGDPARGVGEAFDRHAGVAVAGTLPLDQAAVDLAFVQGRLLSEAAPDSPLALALGVLARQLAGWFAPDRVAGPPAPRRRRRTRVRTTQITRS